MASSDSLDWVLGLGYIRLWEQVHRLEEELMMVGPIPTVIGEAIADTARLNGSNIENRDTLLQRIADAIQVLKWRAGIYIPPAPAPPPGPVAPPAPLLPPATLEDEKLARETLRQIRHSINEFRDDRRQGLVRARNQLWRTFSVINVVCFELVGLAVVVHVPRESMIAAIVIFLVGAIIGLFNRLYLDASTDIAVEDFGLATARLFHTPVFSGIAAVGGVLAIPMLSALANANEVADSSRIIPQLSQIFTLSGRPFSLVLALIFGLTPGALLSRLQKEAEQYKTDLKTSQTP